jgi:hypothetical protein
MRMSRRCLNPAAAFARSAVHAGCRPLLNCRLEMTGSRGAGATSGQRAGQRCSVSTSFSHGTPPFCRHPGAEAVASSENPNQGSYVDQHRVLPDTGRCNWND